MESKKELSIGEIGEAEITLTFKVYGPDTLFLRNLIGEGKVNGKEFEVSNILGSGATLVRIENGPWYLLEVKALLEAIEKL